MVTMIHITVAERTILHNGMEHHQMGRDTKDTQDGVSANRTHTGQPSRDGTTHSDDTVTSQGGGDEGETEGRGQFTTLM